jgi:hypothetical protein
MKMSEFVVATLTLLGLFGFVILMKLSEIYLYAVVAKWAWGK